MPTVKQKPKEKAALEKLKQNLKTIEKFEETFRSQKRKLKKSAEDYEKARGLIQTCEDKLDDYTDLMDEIEKEVTGNNSREREARKLLTNRKRDIKDYGRKLKELKEIKKSELYGFEFKKLFKKTDLAIYEEQLQYRITNFDSVKAADLNMSAERFISEDLATSEKIISEALEDAPKIKISTDGFEHLSVTLTQEIGDLTLAYKAMKSKQSDSQSTAEWILKWAAEKAAGGVVAALAGYVTSTYLIPTVIPALYSYIKSYSYE